MKYILALVIVVLLPSCKGRGKRPDQVRAEDRQKIHNTLEQEMSLKADREQLAELRKDIPDERQKQNDELALYLTLMKQGTEQPNIVRERYHALVQKRRSSYRDKVQKLREDFRKEETKRREEFLKKQKDKRDAFTKKKPDSKATREFFAEQEKERTRHFAEERERRQSFEAELSAQSKDFEGYMRERNNEFNEQFRLYSKQYSEKPKEKKAVTGEGGPENPTGSSPRGFDKLKEVPTTPLGTDD